MWYICISLICFDRTGRLRMPPNYARKQVASVRDLGDLLCSVAWRNQQPSTSPKTDYLLKSTSLPVCVFIGHPIWPSIPGFVHSARRLFGVSHFFFFSCVCSARWRPLSSQWHLRYLHYVYILSVKRVGPFLNWVRPFSQSYAIRVYIITLPSSMLCSWVVV